MKREEWLVDGNMHNGAHFPLCAFTKNASARGNAWAVARSRRKGKGKGQNYSAGAGGKAEGERGDGDVSDESDYQ